MLWAQHIGGAPPLADQLSRAGADRRSRASSVCMAVVCVSLNDSHGGRLSETGMGASSYSSQSRILTHTTGMHVDERIKCSDHVIDEL